MTLPTLDQILTVGVIGAGTMGHGIAYIAALGGARIRLYDAVHGAAQAAITRIAQNFDKAVSLGKVRPADRDVVLARIAACGDLPAACSGADCVIEAVPEQLDLKREIFAAVDKRVPPHALLASNTSSLPIGADYLASTLGPAFTSPDLLRARSPRASSAEGRRGFHRWSADGKKQ